MQIYLKDGPNNGQVRPFVPHMREYRIPVPRELTIKDCLQQSLDVAVTASPPYDVAVYVNTYKATVDAAGRVGCVIFNFDRMDPG